MFRIMAILKKLRIYFFIGLFFIGVWVTTAFTLESPSQAVEPHSSIASTLSMTEGTQKTILENGLTVLTKEVHTAPVVSVQVWYRVGALNEPAGENGLSHQLEHLMFKGTTDRPIQFGRFFSALGSEFNAFTSYDMTAYYNTVEQDKLEAMLVLEADRMINTQIGPEQLDSEKRVVISELQGYENNPEYRLNNTVMRAAMPDRPYGLPVGGTKADVESFTVDQVQRYYQTYYTPDNATLVITGDFDTPTVLSQVKDIFGKVAKRTGNAPAAGVKPLDQPIQTPIVLRQPGSAALLTAVYPLVDINHPDVAAIDLMDTILSVGRSSRLYQALIESGLASDVSTYPAEMKEPGWYETSVTAATGKSLDEIDRVLLQTIATLQQQGVSAEELDRAKTQLKTYLVLSNQDITSQANQLGFYQTVAGDYRYGDRYLAALDQVTPAEIQRVAKTYLDPAKRTVGYFEPTSTDDSVSNSSSGSSRTVENFSPGQPVDPAEVARYLPPISNTNDASSQAIPERFTLENGLRVLLLPDSSTPLINLSGWIDAGSSFDPGDRAGLAGLTAENLLSGTQTKNALDLATTLEDEGVSLEFGARREGVNIDGHALNDKLPTLIQTLAEVLQQATFPTDQLELSRQRSLTDLKEELDDPELLGWRVFRQAIYPPDHPFYSFPTAESLTNITQADVLRFYQTHYRPDTTVLAFVGDFDPQALKSQLTAVLGDWKADGSRPTLQYPELTLPDTMQSINKAIPGKTEAVTYMGYPGIDRQDAHYYAAMVLNQVLGGETLSSRLGTEIRDRQGLTYGIYSFFQAGIHPGPFAIEMQTAPTDVAKAIDSTLALLRQLQQSGLTGAEIEMAKRSITSSYPVDLADPPTLVNDVLYNEVYGLPLEEIRQYPTKIEAVTPEQVQQAITDLIHPDKMVIVTVGTAL